MRKKQAKPRLLVPDPKFGDTLVTRFINNLMVDGKKNLAYRVFYDALDIVEGKTGENGHEVWKKAVENVMPAVEVRSRRIGGATFQIPSEVRSNRRISLGMKWLISHARKRGGRNIIDNLSGEIMAAAKNEGSAVKKKEDTHRMADANKAFSHFKI